MVVDSCSSDDEENDNTDNDCEVSQSDNHEQIALRHALRHTTQNPLTNSF